ncbi:hypothetical protein BJF85_18365 [Saccharomonospora sp. CUA-673]|uniref:DUF5134 domain-containing protein n=1 Tax=Saccharomonospora sp. CUA-673 TaxID=1904969 RepID=UPI000964180F|nr:DUF5134 domain-containing protein [Saccharomonospora sp. CUA-673]OLT45934.1 hypothetical protein BJF85_18365 [Saccharomonospora sp. CUA-673]
MIDAPVLRWLLTLLFVGTTLWHAAVAVLPRVRSAVRVDAVCHTLMGAAMVAMVWPWGMAVLTVPQTVLFVLACGWFLGRTVVGSGHDHADAFAVTRGAGVHHAAMMAAMAWMVASMPSLMGGHGSGGGHHHHALGTTAAVGAEPAVLAAPAAMITANVVLGVVFVLACLPWLAQAFDLGRRLPDPQAPGLGRVVADRTCHAGMTLGMGVMFLATGG